jgi:hypothetical protein
MFELMLQHVTRKLHATVLTLDVLDTGKMSCCYSSGARILVELASILRLKPSVLSCINCCLIVFLICTIICKCNLSVPYGWPLFDFNS